MGQLADRIAFLTTRYGSDPAAWQHELHALAALEESDAKAALARFHELKRRLAEFRRAELLRALRAYAFVRDVPPETTQGWPLQEIEAEIRAATRALAHARAIERALAEEAEARASLRLRAAALASEAPAPAPVSWDQLAPLADAMEARRRAARREARVERRLVDARRRLAKLPRARLEAPDAALPADALDAALDALEPGLREAEALEEAHAAALAPLKAPEVASWRGESRRKLEREADALAARADGEGLRALAARSEALRQEAAALASQAARARRRGGAGPERERRATDPMDGYG